MCSDPAEPEPTNQGAHRLPREILTDVSCAVEATVSPVGRLPGGLNGETTRVRLAGTTDAVLKAVPLTHPGDLDETLRAGRVVQHMRGRGYPTPAWLAAGATTTHVWHLMEYVDAAPAPELTPSLIEQLMEIIEIQAGEASEPYDHWSYAWRVATGRGSVITDPDPNETPEQLRLHRSIATLPEYSSVVSALVSCLREACVNVPPPPAAPDMVHADLATVGNVLVRDKAVIAVVDLGNAGSGTRAIDLTALAWYTFKDPLLDGVRKRLWMRILELVGWSSAKMFIATHIIHMLEYSIRNRRDDLVRAVVSRAYGALDELNAYR